MDDHKLTVIVVEDDKLLLEAITKKLLLDQIQVISCESAEEALEYLQADNPAPDVIWLDYYLKDMNGMEFIQVIKKVPKLASIPVMVVSNSATDEKVQKMRSLGVEKYLLKAEFRLEELIKELKKCVNEKNNRS